VCDIVHILYHVQPRRRMVKWLVNTKLMFHALKRIYLSSDETG